jgi:hypothetical protein
MNDQNQNTNVETPAQAPVTTPIETPQPMPTGWRLVLSRVKPLLISSFNRFYSNKKIFWPVSIVFGILFLVVVLGLIFGNRGGTQNVSKTPTPTPTVQSTPEASESGNVLTKSQSKLKDLKNQIINLDPEQSRLQPPNLNFDIKF